MKKRFATVLCICILFWVGHAQAKIIVEYDAGKAGVPDVSPDPLTQNWLLHRGNQPELTSGPVSPDGSTGLNAWNVNDPLNASPYTNPNWLNYTYSLTSEELGQSDMYGWRMTIYARFVDDYGGYTGPHMQFTDLHGRRYIIFFDLTESGELMGDFWSVGVVVLTDVETSKDYHLHEVVYDPVSDTASYYFDGVLLLSDWAPSNNPYNPPGGVMWGVGSSWGRGSMNYNYVSFEIQHDWYVNPGNGHQYALTLSHSHWEDAEAEAVSVGGHLVTINDQEECDWLVDDSANPFGLQYSRDHYGELFYNLVWIGLEHIGGDKTQPTSWQWQNGEQVGFWNPSPQAFEPQYMDGIHMYMNGSTRSDSGSWAFYSREDIEPGYHLRGIIEVEDVPQLTIIIPNGRENFPQHTTCPITWEIDSNVPVENVLLEYSTDNGEAWQTIDIVENTGLHAWETPHVNSDQCMVRITAPHHPVLGDTSDSVFTVFECQKELESDLNDDCFVSLLDLALMALEWLECGNPFSPDCDVEIPYGEGTDLLYAYEIGDWNDLLLKGNWVSQAHGYRIMPSPDTGPDFGWSYSLPIGVESFQIVKVFRMSPTGAVQIAFLETPGVFEGVGVALSYKWYEGLSVGDLGSDGSNMTTVQLPDLSDGWHELVVDVNATGITANLDGDIIVSWEGSFTPTSITVSGDEFIDWYIRNFSVQVMPTPGRASNPNPQDSSVGVSLTLTLRWDTGEGADSHNFYFGTSDGVGFPPFAFHGNQTWNYVDMRELPASTTFYWRIDEVNEYGTTEGDVWSFTTAGDD